MGQGTYIGLLGSETGACFGFRLCSHGLVDHPDGSVGMAAYFTTPEFFENPQWIQKFFRGVARDVDGVHTVDLWIADDREAGISPRDAVWRLTFDPDFQTHDQAATAADLWANLVVERIEGMHRRYLRHFPNTRGASEPRHPDPMNAVVVNSPVGTHGSKTD